MRERKPRAWHAIQRDGDRTRLVTIIAPGPMEAYSIARRVCGPNPGQPKRAWYYNGPIIPGAVVYDHWCGPSELESML